jgi:RNA polymerase sigma-70 factor (ECF subfamily)
MTAIGEAPLTATTRGPGRPDPLAPSPDDPAALIARIARGDRDAFGRFYDAFPGAAEDVLQEVFWQVWREAAQYDPGRGRPEAWLLMRARTRAIDRLRSMRRREQTFVMPLDESAAPPAQGAAPSSAAVEERGAIESALDRLPDPQRQVIELAFFEGLTQSEIAVRLGEPLGTVKTRARLGLERLRRALHGERLETP